MGLELAYSRARDIIGRESSEYLDVVEEVERLRSAWRPERVRVILLAESHVWTSREETRSRVKQPDDTETGFARFVYCLGYGEPQLVAPSVWPNRGTPQYWRLFHDAVYGPDSPNASVMKKGTLDQQQRVQNKLNLLKAMQAAGIWLIDASVSALYRNGTKLAAGDHYRAVLKACWESHIGDVLHGCAPSAVLIVGRGVDGAIGNIVRQDLGHGVEVGLINQPNAHISRETMASDRRDCFCLCCRHRS
jgi:hypothetical protein